MVMVALGSAACGDPGPDLASPAKRVPCGKKRNWQATAPSLGFVAVITQSRLFWRTRVLWFLHFCAFVCFSEAFLAVSVLAFHLQCALG